MFEKDSKSKEMHQGVFKVYKTEFTQIIGSPEGWSFFKGCRKIEDLEKLFVCPLVQPKAPENGKLKSRISLISKRSKFIEHCKSMCNRVVSDNIPY